MARNKAETCPIGQTDSGQHEMGITAMKNPDAEEVLRVRARYPEAIAVWKYEKAYVIESINLWNKELGEGRSSIKLAWKAAARRIE